MKVSIIGAGTWGIALAKVLSKNHNVTVWCRLESDMNDLITTHKHKNLKDIIIPGGINFTNNLKLAVCGSEFIIIAVASLYVRNICELIKDYLVSDQIIVCVAKGIECNSLFTMTEVINDVIGDSNNIVALSGPTHAEEVALDMPTLIVSASSDLESAKKVQNLFVGTCIRPYTNEDIKGVEICGALKNIIALACGISTGCGFGDNSKAAIITRGLSEIINLGKKMSCATDTFFGLSGIGDLIVTSTSIHSRNNKCGYLIGNGYSVSDAVKEVGMVVEGINALPAAIELANKYEVELPIIMTVNEIVSGKITPMEALDKLFSRDVKSELSKSMDKIRFENELLNRLK